MVAKMVARVTTEINKPAVVGIWLLVNRLAAFIFAYFLLPNILAIIATLNGNVPFQ